MSQKTYCMIKPDAVARGLVGLGHHRAGLRHVGLHHVRGKGGQHLSC